MRHRHSIVLAFVVLIALAGCQPNPASVAGPTPITESAATPTVSAATRLAPAATAVPSSIPPSSQHEALPAPGSLLTAAQHGVTVTLESIEFNSDETVVDYVAAIDPGWGFAFDPHELPPQQLTQAGLPVAVDENGRTYPARSYAGGPPAQDQVDPDTHMAHTRGRFVFAPVSGAELNLQLRFALMTVRSLPPIRLTVADPNQKQPVALPPRLTFGPLSAATRSAVWMPARTFALTLEGVKQDGLLLNCLYLYTDPQTIPPDYRGCSLTPGVPADRSDQIRIEPAVDLSRPIEVRVAADVEFIEPFVFKWIRTQAAGPAASPMAAGATATYSPPASDRPAFKYIVVAGDTCAAIATKFRTTTDKLLAANALPDCTQIRVGMELFIPRSVPYDIKLYVVLPGDTFASIAAAFGLKTETLLWSNADQGATPDNLRVGQVLLVPPIDGAIHLVQASDTLAQVASRYQVPAAVIASYPANDLSSAFAALLPGSLLVIPGGRLSSPPPSGAGAAPAVNGIAAFTYAPSGLLFVVTAHSILLLDPATRQVQWTTPVTGASYLAVALAGNVVAAIAGGGGYVYAWDTRSGQQLYGLVDSAQHFSALAFSRDGQTLATGEYAQIRLWDAHSGLPRATWPTGEEGLKNYPWTTGITNMAYSQDDHSLFSANWWTGQVMRWDAAAHGLQSSFVLTNVVRYDFTPDANHLLADFDRYGFEFRSPRTGAVEATHDQIIGAAGFETFSADGRRVAVWGYNAAHGSTAAVWELATDTLVQQVSVGSLDGPGWTRGALNADGSVLALSDERADQIHFIDVATGKEVGSFSVP